MIPFTDSPSAQQVAFTPLGPDLSLRRSWQLQIGDFLPIPAPDTPLTKVLDFRQAYSDEREELVRAVLKLLLSVQQPTSEAESALGKDEIDKAVQQIEKAVQRLEKAGHSNKIIWLKRSLWVLGGLGAAAAGAFAPPLSAWLFTAFSSLGISIAAVVTRPGVSTEFAYLQHLRSTFPDATWPSATPTT